MYENFNFVYHPSFFLSFIDKLSSKTIVCMRIYTYQTTALLLVIFLFWFGLVYKLRLVSYGHETVSDCLQRRSARLVVGFLGFCSIIPDVARRVRPHPDH